MLLSKIKVLTRFQQRFSWEKEGQGHTSKVSKKLDVQRSESVWAELRSIWCDRNLCPPMTFWQQQNYDIFAVKLHLLFGLVHVGTLFAHVECGLGLWAHAFDFQERGILMLVTQTSLESCEDSLHVQPVSRCQHVKYTLYSREQAIYGKITNSCFIYEST